MLACLGVLIGRLWWEQVARGDVWTKKIASRSEVTVRIPSVRGEIRDRNGITLVGNRASYEVDFYLPDMVHGYRAQNKGKVPLNTVLTTERQMLTERKEADVVQIVNSSIIPKLQDLDLARDYNAERLQKHFRDDTEIPFTYMDELDFKTIAKFSEHNVGLPGVEISLRPVRQYVYGALAAHLLGYVGAPLDIRALPDVDKYTFYQPDVEGKSQIEQSMDKYLRGKPGVRVLARSVKGVIESEVRREDPEPGANVYLTLDARVQYIVEEALRHPALGRAAAVVVDPNNGEILGMGSIPSFDPNVFIPSISSENWEALNKDEAIPLVNRAVSGFPPGSTFKIVTAFAGLRKNMANKHFNCPGGINYGDHTFHCWIAEKHGSHGMLGLADALKVSCDCFFYQYGNEASIQSIDYVGSMLGIGQKYDLGLSDEKEGCMPGPEWMKIRYPQEKWSQAYTANVSIGQGYVLASPLQMAMAYVAVANGGIAYEPRLVKKVLDQNDQPARDEDGNIAVLDQPKIRKDLRTEFTPDQIGIVRQGLFKVVNDSGGTGGKARLKNVEVAGKTGSAQATDRGKKDTIAWFCCYAPADHPRYVIATMVQGAKHGGSVAAPIAAHILEQCLAMDQGSLKVDLTRLPPAHSDHPFTSLETLPDYKNATTINLQQEDESADQKEPGEEQMGKSKGEPDIRAKPDARGKVSNRAASTPVPVPQGQPEHRGFLQRLFGGGSKPAPAPAPRSAPGNPPLQPFRH